MDQLKVVYWRAYYEKSIHMIDQQTLEKLKDDFLAVAKISGLTPTFDSITIERHPAPHKPPTDLPKGKCAVYVFFLKESCLKVGKVGAKSRARYVHQHYNPKSSQSNLAKSLIQKQEQLAIEKIDTQSVGEWIAKHTSRVNFLLDANEGISTLNLLEIFLQCRLSPKFEGFDSQK